MTFSTPRTRVDQDVNTAVEPAHSDICPVIPDFLYTYHAVGGQKR
jgi:hypothetical protein